MKLALFALLSCLGLIPMNAKASMVPGQNFDRAIFVIFENTDYRNAITQPFFKKLAREGAVFSNFEAATHPSQGNYVALTSGSVNGVRGDGNIDLDVPHIADLLDSKNISWRIYAEDFPGDCFQGATRKDYARKHNPFISYVNIQDNPKRCANIVNVDQFEKDAASGTLPQYAFYVPNLKNDGHDTGVKFADAWYQKNFGVHFQNQEFMKGTLVITTFDESGNRRDNQIYTSFIGPMVKPGTDVQQPTNLYSLLRMIEDNWQLGTLGKEDLNAPLIPDVWK